MSTVSPKFVGLLTPENTRWSETLLKTAHDFFHLPGFLKASASHEGGEPLLFLLDFEEHGMLVPLIRRSLGEFGEAFSSFSDASSPYGYPGPLYWGGGCQERVAEMHAFFEAFLRQEKVVSVFLRLNPFVGPADNLLAPLGRFLPHGPTVYIDLRDRELSWSGINSQNRRFISQVIQRGYEVRFEQWDTANMVIDAYYETMQRLNAAPSYFFARDYFAQLRENTSGHFHLATVFAPTGEVSGGCFFTEVGGLIHYFLMGAFGSYMDVSPAKLLINALRLWGHEMGHHTLNLGGGLGARRDGLFDFKSRLSKSSATFSTFRKILLPDTYQALAQAQGCDNQEEEFFPIYRKPRSTPRDVNQSVIT